MERSAWKDGVTGWRTNWRVRPEHGKFGREVLDADEQIKELKRSGRSSRELKELQERFIQQRNAEARILRDGGAEQAIRSLGRVVPPQGGGRGGRRHRARANCSPGHTGPDSSRSGVHGTIAELAEVDDKYSTAMNTPPEGLGHRGGGDGVAECIQYLKRHDLGRATFLPLNKMLDGRPRGKAILAAKEAVGFAIDLVRFYERYRAAFWYVFGDTVVVDTLDHARKLMGGVRLVTMGGELLEASGAMIGGKTDASSLRFGAPSRGKLEEIAAKLNQAVLAAERLEAEIAQVRKDMAALQDRIRELSGAGGASDVTLKALESRRQELRMKLDKLKTERADKASEMQAVTRSITELDARLASGEKCLNDIRSKRETSRARLEQLAPAEMSIRLKQLQSDVVSLTASPRRTSVQTLDARLRWQSGGGLNAKRSACREGGEASFGIPQHWRRGCQGQD